jgi:beta-glucosidase
MRQSFDARVDDVDLHETYLPGWVAAASGPDGCAGAMCSYNAVNGVPACADGVLLNHWFRDTWGFSGFVISDANAVKKIDIDSDGGHHYAPNASAAAAAALAGGCDVSYGAGFGSDLSDAVSAGECGRAAVEVAARRTLEIRMRAGDFDPPDVVRCSHAHISSASALQSVI